MLRTSIHISKITLSIKLHIYRKLVSLSIFGVNINLIRALTVEKSQVLLHISPQCCGHFSGCPRGCHSDVVFFSFSRVALFFLTKRPLTNNFRFLLYSSLYKSDCEGSNMKYKLAKNILLVWNHWWHLKREKLMSNLICKYLKLNETLFLKSLASKVVLGVAHSRPWMSLPRWRCEKCNFDVNYGVLYGIVDIFCHCFI